MPPFIDLTGQTFGRLTVVRRATEKEKIKPLWECLCSCGVTIYRVTHRLKHGKITPSCGCYNPDLIDLTGQEFGRLKAVRYVGELKWECVCSCGIIVSCLGSNLRRGTSRSCGCLCRDRAVNHGHAIRGKLSRTYFTWNAMLQRCNNPKYKKYKNYGGRGIKVCERWHKFENFLSDMGEKPPGLTIERKDVNGDYCPNNCEWASFKQQARNRRNTVLITIEDRTQCLQAWCDELDQNYYTVWHRLKKGWSLEDALLTPVKKRAVQSQ